VLGEIEFKGKLPIELAGFLSDRLFRGRLPKRALIVVLSCLQLCSRNSNYVFEDGCEIASRPDLDSDSTGPCLGSKIVGFRWPERRRMVSRSRLVLARSLDSSCHIRARPARRTTAAFPLATWISYSVCGRCRFAILIEATARPHQRLRQNQIFDAGPIFNVERLNRFAIPSAWAVQERHQMTLMLLHLCRI